MSARTLRWLAFDSTDGQLDLDHRPGSLATENLPARRATLGLGSQAGWPKRQDVPDRWGESHGRQGFYNGRGGSIPRSLALARHSPKARLYGNAAGPVALVSQDQTG